MAVVYKITRIDGLCYIGNYQSDMLCSSLLKTNPISKNGSPIKYNKLFSEEYSKRFCVTSANIGKIISNKSWNGAVSIHEN